MIGIILASHGKFAQESLKSAEMIMGSQESIIALALEPEDDPQELKNKIYEAVEIHSAIERLNHKDIIMVDTAGRSHKNKQQVMELQSLLDQVEEKEIFLVVSCTAKNNDIREILDTYEFINNYKIILTKIDEATTYGTIINTALRTQKPISYLTTGQSVPDDIEAMNADKVVSLLMKEA